MKDLYTCE